MQAVITKRYGKTNDVIQLADVPMPTIGQHDILVQNHAASLNPIDYKIRNGMLKAVLPKTFPRILGHDLSGVVTQVGASVTDYKVGDEVFARIDAGRAGTLAEYSAISASAAALKPTNLSHEQAAALPLVSLTSWQALVDVGQLKAGQKVFIPAGSGGVGSIAIQIAKSLGAFVATNTSSKNVAWVKALGADIVIDYTQQDFAEVLRDYDIVYDTMGGDTLIKSFGILKKGGKVISITATPTPESMKPYGSSRLIQTILWFMNRPYKRLSKKFGVAYHFLFMKADGKQLARIAQLTTDGQLKVIIDKTFTLSDIKAAFDHLETGRTCGKVVIEIIEPVLISKGTV